MRIISFFLAIVSPLVLSCDLFGRCLTAPGRLFDRDEKFAFRFSTIYYDSETGLYAYAHRYYNPETGRWTSRDPAGEVRTDNQIGGSQAYQLYGFVNNDSINRWDHLGLLTIERNSNNPQAKICFDNNDKFKDLADKTGLDNKDWRKWLRDEKGNPIEGNKIYTGKTYLIPNTVIAYWADDRLLYSEDLAKYWVDWDENIEYLKERGFKVEEFNAGNGVKQDYEIKLESSASKSILHGTYYWGHGYEPFPSKGLLAVSPKRQDLLTYSTLSIPYKTGFTFIFACDSNTGKSAFNSTIWHGYTGYLIPLLNPWGSWLPGINQSEWKIRTYLKPGDQGTNK